MFNDALNTDSEKSALLFGYYNIKFIVVCEKQVYEANVCEWNSSEIFKHPNKPDSFENVVKCKKVALYPVSSWSLRFSILFSRTIPSFL